MECLFLWNLEFGKVSGGLIRKRWLSDQIGGQVIKRVAK